MAALTIALAYAALFVCFQVNARVGEQVERRDVVCFGIHQAPCRAGAGLDLTPLAAYLDRES